MPKRNMLIAGILSVSGMTLGACGAADPTTTAPSGAQDGAHVHGVGTLSVTIESDRLAATVLAPGANFIGTNGDAMDEEAMTALVETSTALIDIPSAADCALTDTSLGKSVIGEDDHNDHAEHDEHDDDHSDHGDHDEDHSEHEDDHTGHTDITITHTFECGNMDALDGFDVRLFESFGGFEKVSVLVFTDENESFVEALPDAISIAVPR